MTNVTVPGVPEDAASQQCVCQEDPGGEPCACPVPVTRQQLARLRAYADQHPERVFIVAEMADGAWMSALADFLPEGTNGEEPVAAWMSAPYSLPPAAALRSSLDLGELLDMLGAPRP